MRITTKIIGFSIGMLVILALAISIPSTVISYQSKQKELQELERMLRQSFDNRVSQEVETVMSLLKATHLKVEAGELNEEEAQQLAAHQIRELRYDGDGYFWIDTKEGINVVLLGKKEVEGKSRWDLQDAKGNYLIRNINNVAVEGGGYTEYWFPKQGETEPLPKRSYSAYFEPYNWVVGTGNYIDDIENEVNVVKEAQMKQLRDSIWMMVLITVFMLLVFGAISVLFGRRLAKSIITLSENTESVSQGLLTVDIHKTENDEIGTLQASLQKTILKLREIIEEIVQGASNVATASEQMAQSSEHISQGAATQAASTEEISSSIEEMVSNIHSNAANAHRTEVTAGKAGKGIEALQETVKLNLDAMESINNKVTIIKDIAFQTNILALNASVEAARAGEAGKGFSVVAAEVRKLSEVTKTAAEEIDTLTTSSLDIAEKSWSSMEELLPEIKTIIDMIQDIMASSKEQESGANHINSAIQQLVSITSENSAASEEMASSSEELSRQAEILSETISFFKVK